MEIAIIMTMIVMGNIFQDYLRFLIMWESLLLMLFLLWLSSALALQRVF